MKRAVLLLLLIPILASCISAEPTAISATSRPTIELIAPPSGERIVQGQELEIESRSVDERGIERIELWLDDGIYRVDNAGAQPTFHVIQRWRADTPGQHTLRVLAINVDGLTSPAASVVVEVLDPSVFTPTPSPTPLPTDTATPQPTPTQAPTPTPLPKEVNPTATPATAASTTPTPTLTSGTTTDMILVPGGSFLMGSNLDHIDQAASWCGCGRRQFEDELYMHEVYVSSFRIQKYPVTNQQYMAFVNASGYQTDAERKKEVNTWRTAFTAGKDDHPVVWMSWNDANAYCQWAGLRLPTEAEWEKAARGDDARLWPWGNEWDSTRLNMAENGINTTTPVGTYAAGASPYGVMDMAGNVWEWVADWYGATYYQHGADRDRDPRGPEGGQDRVLRGASFRNGMHDVRTANRHKGGMTGYAPDHGFRCVTSVN